MQFSEAWLREWVNPPVDSQQLAHQLTMAGLEVDSIEPAALQFTSVVIGEVVDCQPHPDADRLTVCQVSVGEEKQLQIVCGANNVKAGIRVPTAIEGAELPDNFKIKATILRGIQSAGMLCAATELGLGDQSDGLMILPADAPVGEDIRDYLQLEDTIFEVDLTPNRADCLSIRGIAREVALLNQSHYQSQETPAISIAAEKQHLIQVDEPASCPLYLGRVIENVKPFAVTPLWMQERLRRSGLRSLGAVIDVTNYVLLELGQPLHAFDLDKISGTIHVRFAAKGEKLLLLNDQEIEMSDTTLVIADDEKALALAGIMGGSQSAVSDNTIDLLLECAFFSPKVIMGKARNYGLHTDSSHRFERGVDPELQTHAIEYATQLIISIAGGRPGPIVDVKSEQDLPSGNTILLRRKRLSQVLGQELEDQRVTDILNGLGMSCSIKESGWEVRPPSFRFDVAIEADLVEEIARIHGYDQLPKRQIKMPVELSEYSETAVTLDRLKDILVDRDYQEAITFSFGDSDLLQQFEPELSGLVLKNPISSELSTMRTSLWPGLIQALQYNLNRQQERVRLFESGLKFIRENEELLQNYVLAGAITGTIQPLSWTTENRTVDFFDIKADIEAIFGAGRHKIQFTTGKHPALHPGQTAFVRLDDGAKVGVLGMLHPELEKQLGFDRNVFVFEINLVDTLKRNVPHFEVLSRFPAVRRDLSITVKNNVLADDLVNAILKFEGSLIKNVTIFDVYHGKGVESGYKSVALALILQDKMKTLTDVEIDAIVSGVLVFLEEKFDARLRD
ncbi:MAG TPA: phenylalanine--tRNA ligase subunit beta [Crenotrichaceae bacterium]|nr:phenylalanine--tRNA ligase subunit beta [Crenotrichaceae bacterium]